MKDDLPGAKEEPSPTDHTVVPPRGVPFSSVQRNAVPPHSWTSMPRCFLYHAWSLPGSLALKKMPPMPVTRFIARSPNEGLSPPEPNVELTGRASQGQSRVNVLIRPQTV